MPVLRWLMRGPARHLTLSIVCPFADTSLLIQCRPVKELE